jgi:hypothetical protein
MPQRVTGICTAVAGLCFVMFLVLLRFDLQRAAKTGPRWKRNLVTAGLVVLTTLGLAGGTTGCEKEPMTTCYAPPMENPSVPANMLVDRLSRRLPLLEEYAKADRLDPKVVNVLLETVEQDAANLEIELKSADVTPQEKEQALQTLKEVRERVGQVRAKLKEQE